MGLEGLSLGHILVVLLVVVLVFGTRKVRDVGGDLGHAIREFKKTMNEDEAAPADKRQAAAPLARESESGTTPPPAA